MNGKGLYGMLRRFAPGAVVLLLAGCSYVMDSIESAITARASFSIEAEYSGGMVTIRWDEGSGLSSFAGYEIYVTLDEYDDYDLLASRFENESGATVVAGDYKNLDSSFTGSYSYAPPPGIYFYRVGIIEWDEDDEEMQDRYGPFYFDDPIAYNAETSINKISGYRMVSVH
ncbi:MAG: hypothetical protein EHM32_11150 [Spirochaetales bacterium]|nr:MAG: hypothetical protein EHM32_11150 [Spirochaetales bacterium]